MINPTEVTDFARTEVQLHEFLVFAVCVAGKQSQRIARAVDALYRDLGGGEPFLVLIARLTEAEAVAALHRRGITPHTQKGHALHRLAAAWEAGELCLKTCPTDQLEGVRWVGAKTARFFVLHSRPGVRAAVLDTHVLAYLRDKGVAGVPRASPPKGSTAYRRLEELVLKTADADGISPAEFDLGVWKQRAVRA